jgi:hypothetical protein
MFRLRNLWGCEFPKWKFRPFETINNACRWKGLRDRISLLSICSFPDLILISQVTLHFENPLINSLNSSIERLSYPFLFRPGLSIMQLQHLLLSTIATTSITAFNLLSAETPIPTIFRRDKVVSSTPSPTPTGNFITTQFITLPGQTNAYVTLPAQTITLAIPTCIQTIVPDKNGYVPPGTCGSQFAYYPSFGAATAFTIIFGVLTGVHIFLAAKWKAVSEISKVYLHYTHKQ